MRLRRVTLIVHRISEDKFTIGRDQTDYQTLLGRSAGVEAEEDFEGSSDEVKARGEARRGVRREARFTLTLTL
jgi:hypothetical protein